MIRFLASRPLRIFLIVWIGYSAHFATNIVREHYPAFSIAEQGTFKVDRYQGFHADIFVHRDGHSYVGNNVIVSVIAAIPLFVFDPVLDALERYSKRKLEENSKIFDEYRTDKPNRVAFFNLVKEQGLDLRFGAATVVTSVFLMAPLTALMVVLMYGTLARRNVTPGNALWLALLFAFGTPIFFRQAHLNHNMFLMYALFVAFLLLWRRPDRAYPVPLGYRLAAGFLGGFTLAVDYIGVLTLCGLYLLLFFDRLSTADWVRSFRESLAYVLASIPPVLFLLYSQWAMYGNPFLPGQYWMPEQNIYVQEGWRGFDWPALDLFFKNLFDPAYGMYAFGPVLILGLLPTWYYRENEKILPRELRRFIALTVLAFLVFCAANQYSRLQWNTGFRYLVPLVPLVYLAACDHLVRMPRWLRVPVTIVAVLHSWVLTVFREPVPDSWQMFFDEGLTFPWLRVLRMTRPSGSSMVSHPLLPWLVLGITLLLILGIWRLGERASRTYSVEGRSGCN